MFLHVHDDVEIAGRAAARAGFAFAAQAETLAAGNTGGNLDGQLALLLYTSRSATRRARRADDRSAPAALAAGACDSEEPLLVSQLAPSLTLRARLRLRAGRRARSVTGLARLVARNLNRGLDALRGFVE